MNKKGGGDKNATCLHFFKYVLNNCRKFEFLISQGISFLLLFFAQFITYGFFQCVDGFLFIFTFLPLRFIKAVFKFCVRGCLTSWWVTAISYTHLSS